MFESAVLDVAMGLALVFLLVSLLVTAVAEVAAGVLKWRSAFLWRGLEQLLQSPAARNALYDHPLIKGLARVNVVKPEWKDGRNGPSYIPSRTFALALIDIMRGREAGAFPETVAALEPLRREAGDDIDRFRENVEIWFNDGMDRVSGWYKRHISAVQMVIGLALAVAINIDALQVTRTLWREPTLRRSLVAAAEGAVRNPPAALAPAAAGTPGQPAPGGKALTVVMSTARLLPGEVATLYVTLPAPAADRAPLIVERLSPHLALGETPQEVTAPRIERPLRAGETEAAVFVKAAAANAESRERIRTIAGGQEVVSEILVAPPGNQQLASLMDQVGALGLPIGWSCPADVASAGGGAGRVAVGGPFWCASPDTLRSWSWWLAVGLKDILAIALGWMITGAAVSLGAPFWFDTLKRIVSIRSSGRPPEEKPLSPKEVPQPREPGQRPMEADLVNALKR